MNSQIDQQATVHKDSYLTLHYRIALLASAAQEIVNDVINTFVDRPATLQLGSGQLAETLEAKLLGLKVGDHTTFDFPAGEAFGEHNPQLLQAVSRKLLEREAEFGADYQPGDAIEFNAPNGARYAGTVKQIDQQNALFDFNHPLAGQAIRFEVKILAIL